MGEETGETIKAVAIVWDGHVATLPSPLRHCHVMAAICGLFPDNRDSLATQGFVTDAGRYVDRYEAAQIAIAAGQIDERDLSPTGQLFSEDLW